MYIMIETGPVSVRHVRHNRKWDCPPGMLWENCPSWCPPGMLWENCPCPPGMLWENCPCLPGMLWENCPCPPGMLWENCPCPPGMLWENCPCPPGMLWELSLSTRYVMRELSLSTRYVMRELSLSTRYVMRELSLSTRYVMRELSLSTRYVMRELSLSTRYVMRELSLSTRCVMRELSLSTRYVMRELSLSTRYVMRIVPVHQVCYERTVPVHQVCYERIVPVHQVYYERIVPVHQVCYERIVPVHQVCYERIVPVHQVCYENCPCPPGMLGTWNASQPRSSWTPVQTEHFSSVSPTTRSVKGNSHSVLSEYQVGAVYAGLTSSGSGFFLFSSFLHSCFHFLSHCLPSEQLQFCLKYASFRIVIAFLQKSMHAPFYSQIGTSDQRCKGQILVRQYYIILIDRKKCINTEVRRGRFFCRNCGHNEQGWSLLFFLFFFWSLFCFLGWVGRCGGGSLVLSDVSVSSSFRLITNST